MAKKPSKSVQRDPASASPKDSFWVQLNPLGSLQEAGGVVRDSLRKAPPEQVAFIVISFLAVVVAIVVCVALIWKGEYVLGGVLAGVVVVLLGFGMWCISRMRSQQTPPGPAIKSPTAEWSRVTVKVPIEPDKLNELAGRVRTVRDLAKTRYSALLRDRKSPPSQTDPDSVRVNVFLPDTRNVLDGEVCALFIPKGLHHGMKNDAERGLRFRPDEGVTGRVFTQQQPIGTRRTSAIEEWEWIDLEGTGGIGDNKFQLTQVQMRLIDESLRWIISFPLMVDVAGKPHTAGVLNVDGLSEVLTPEEMQAIYHTLEPTVKDFAKRLARLDKCRITIAVEDIAAEVATSTA